MKVLDVDLTDEEAAALLVVTEIRSHESAEADELRRARFDLDAFVYASSKEE